MGVGDKMVQQYKIGKVNTKVYNKNGFFCVKYHSTEIIKFNKDMIILNSGGWYTNTTKNRINQTCNQYDLCLNVFQKAYDWFVEYNNKIIPFKDNMIIKRGDA